LSFWWWGARALSESFACGCVRLVGQAIRLWWVVGVSENDVLAGRQTTKNEVQDKDRARPHSRTACPRVTTGAQGDPYRLRSGSLFVGGSPWTPVVRLRPGHTGMRTPQAELCADARGQDPLPPFSRSLRHVHAHDFDDALRVGRGMSFLGWVVVIGRSYQDGHCGIPSMLPGLTWI
jgi:hypothetical protein